MHVLVIFMYVAVRYILSHYYKYLPGQKYLFYKDKVTEKEEQAEKAESLPNRPHMWGLRPAEVRSQKFHPHLPHRWQGPRKLNPELLFPKPHTNRKLEFGLAAGLGPCTLVWNMGIPNDFLPSVSNPQPVKIWISIKFPSDANSTGPGPQFTPTPLNVVLGVLCK